MPKLKEGFTETHVLFYFETDRKKSKKCGEARKVVQFFKGCCKNVFVLKSLTIFARVGRVK